MAHYIVNLLDVDGTQIPFSSELALDEVQAVRWVDHMRHIAKVQACHKARITVTSGLVKHSYSLVDTVTVDDIRRDLSPAKVCIACQQAQGSGRWTTDGDVIVLCDDCAQDAWF